MNIENTDQRLTAYALGELSGEELQRFEAELAEDELAQTELATIGETSRLLARELGQPSGLRLGQERLDRIEKALASREEEARDDKRQGSLRVWAAASLAAALALLVGTIVMRSSVQPEALSRTSLVVASAVPVENAPLAKELREPPNFHDQSPSRERDELVEDNPFVAVAKDRRSTFSIDVDTASYSLVRSFLSQGQRPPKVTVRIEELVNYFSYSYPEPRAGEPFSISTDVASAPWAPEHQLVRIGLKGRHIDQASRPGANLVFLIDVSGSMNAPNRLPLVKEGLSQLARRLDARDRVAIVVYAGASGLVLPPTAGSDSREIERALDRLQAGGSTNGGEGIELAYAVARRNFIPGGVNRVILATDGDFNVGVTSESDLSDLIQQKARSGVFLSVLGFGRGNYKDATLELLADKGNGNYAYIDTRDEARKVLVQQASGTLITIAKDVKIQIEFNPREVEAFRLIGYENRVLSHQAFDDDRKDAGEIGTDHTVTALYELVPTNAPGSRGALMDVKLRYKLPKGETSRLIERSVNGSELSWPVDFRFAAAVAEFGLLLRDSPHKAGASYDAVLARAGAALGDGPDREVRREFLELVRRARELR